MPKHTHYLLSLALAAALAAPAAAQQSGGTKVGLLTCKTSASLGLIIGSHQKIALQLRARQRRRRRITKAISAALGLDLGVKGGGVMTWAVFAPVNGYHHGALGRHLCRRLSGSASLGVGVGANALVGGSHRSVALQPLSVEGNVGVNLALGVAGLTLRSVR